MTCDEYVLEEVRIEDCGEEVKFFFNPAFFRPSATAISKTIGELVFTNNCIGACSDRLYRGDLRIYFNPIVNSNKEKEYTIKKIVAAIKQPDPEQSIRNILS